MGRGPGKRRLLSFLPFLLLAAVSALGVLLPAAPAIWALTRGPAASTAATRGVVAGAVAGALVTFGVGAGARLAAERRAAQLAAAARRLAEGDFSFRAEYGLGEAGGDSLDAAARSLAAAAETLEQLVHASRESAEEAARASEDLARVAAQVERGVHEVAQTVSEMAAGLEREASAAAGTAHRAREMDELAHSVSHAAAGIAAAAQSAADLTREGRQSVAETSGRMERLQSAIRAAASAMDRLRDHSRSIGRIVEMVDTVSEQTDLLALNAAIEAAHAGDHGRGFAVVAQEVRRLAEQSRQATAEIAALVGKVQQVAEAAARQMEESLAAMEAGVEAAGRSAAAFSAIAAAVESVSRQIGEVHRSAQRMAEAGQQVREAVDVVAATVQEQSAAAQSVAATSEEQSAALAGIARSAAALAGVSERVRRAVAAFEVARDLAAARELLEGKLRQVAEAVATAAASPGVAREIPGGGAREPAVLEDLRRAGDLDFLLLLGPGGGEQARHPLVRRALRGAPAAAVMVEPAGFLARLPDRRLPEYGNLAERARIPLLPTPNARPTTRTEETSGLVLEAAAPVRGPGSRVAGVVLGGVLLNRRFDVVDEIRDRVFGRAAADGTCTIFLGDVRVTTNVLTDTGERAVGTRVSAEVAAAVLDRGDTWHRRAWVVNAWVTSGYGPLRDADGRVIGILYVGMKM